jgi:hypothetical protein
MITIDRDYQSATDDRFKVKANDPGFGRWSVRRLTLDAALETVKHYYGTNHNKAICGHCSEKPKAHKSCEIAPITAKVSV